MTGTRQVDRPVLRHAEKPADRSGVFVAVVGPSGAGKDSIMRLAQDLLGNDPAIHFVRRVITRAGNGDEDHASVTHDEFAAMAGAGAFALTWTAHGLHYAIPATVRDELARGHVVIANASRDQAPAIKAAFPRAIIVHVTASFDVLRSRLLARGREDADSVDLRLARSLMLEQGFTADIRIENNGALETATKQFMNAIAALKPVISA